MRIESLQFGFDGTLAGVDSVAYSLYDFTKFLYIYLKFLLFFLLGMFMGLLGNLV